MMEYVTIALAMLCAGMAGAQTNCAPYERLADMLAEKFGESEVGRGIADGGAVVQIWVGPETWSVVTVSPNGTACIRAGGEGWEFFEPVIEPAGSVH